MQKNAKTQITGVATATTTNGNGKKAKNNVKVIPFDEFDRENATKITPHFRCLSTKGVEMFSDMGNLENAKLFIDDLAMETDQTTTTGLMMILDAIGRKIEENNKSTSALDYINWLQDYLFHWTTEAINCRDSYIEAIRSGNFVVEEMPESKGEVWAEGIFPPKYKKGISAEIASLAETVRELQEKISGNKSDLVTNITHASASLTFEAVQNASVEELGLILSALKDNKNLPVKMSDAIYDFITLSADPTKLENADYNAEFVAECIRHQNLRATEKKENSDSSPIEPANFEGMYLSEFWHSDGEIPDRSLLLEVQQFPEEPSPRIVTSVYRERTDGRFVLVINYLPDSKEEYPYQSEEPEEESLSDKYTHHRLQVMTNQVCHILKSDKVSDDMKEAFTSIIFEAGNEAGMAVTDPDLIRIALPKIIDSFEFNYGSGIVLAIDALLNSFLGSNFYETELRQYEGRLEDAERDELANHLSAVLNNPQTPKNLYDAISDELSSLFDGRELTKMVDSPEFIRKALKTKEPALAA